MVVKNNVSSMPARPDGIGTRKIVRDFTEDYVVAGGYSIGQQRVLMGTTDDVEIEVDLRTYDLMENDSTIIKTKHILTTGTLADEMQLAPGATEAEVGADEYQVYVKIMEFCERCICGLDRPYRESLDQLLGNAIKYGHGIAETEWAYRMDGDSTKPDPAPQQEPISKVQSMWTRFGYYFGLKGQKLEMAESNAVLSRPTLNSEKLRLMPIAVKVKPRNAVRFVVDDFMNVLGLIPRYKNGTNLTWSEIVDRDKFLVLTVNKKDEDPRGKSMYRAAFNWHNLKIQLPAEMLRFILEESVPKAVAVLAENANPFEIERDSDGNIIYEDDTNQTPRMVTAAESLKRIIEDFRSGSGVVLPHDTELRPYKTSAASGSDADLFTKIIKIIDDQIENAILLQTLAQSEGAHQARSASQQVAELLHNLIFWLRWQLGMMTLTDLFEVAVKMNFGEWATRYLPQVSLGDFVRRDWGADLAIVADAYFKGFIDDTQRAELMAWLNLPKPGVSRQQQNADAAKQIGAQQDVNGQPIQPNNNRPDKQAGTNNRNNGNGTEKKNVKQPTQSVSGIGLGDSLGHHKRGAGFVSRYLFSGRK